MSPSRPELTIREAAKACGVSDKTIRRNLDKFPEAHRLGGPRGPETGPWSIPVADLIAAGYQPGTPSPPEEPDDPKPEPRTGTVADELRRRIEALEAEAAEHERRETELRHRAELAEALADERALALDDARTALRMLEAATAPQAPTAAPDTPDATRERPMGWLRRTFGR